MDGTRRRLASQLCAAVNNGDPRSVQLLLSKGASPNLVGRKGVAAIHLAVGRETEKNMRCLKMLLQHEADPNIRSSEGLTPLHVAAIWGCCQNLKVLLTNGGNPHIKDNEGNTPAKLAEQHDNKRCARLLQQYQFSSADTEEEEDFPHYQYSVCSDQTDMSGYPESDCSFSSSHVGLSSTRLSSLFNLSNVNGGPSCRGASFAGPSVLSSTRISAARPAAPKEEVSCFEEALITKDNKQAAPDNGVISPSRMNAPPEFSSRRASRKSVSFLNVDEYFPVFSPKSPPEQSSEIIQCPDALPFDMAEYPDFLDSDRMASVLPQQGIDVTSPDHVFVFCRDSSESTEEDLEKTVIGHISLKLDDDEPEGQNNNNGEPPVNPSERQEQAQLASSSSGTSGSHYSSCESDHYTSCLDPPVPPEQPVFPPVEGPESDKRTKLDSTESENELLKGDDIVQAEPKTDSKSETTEPLSDLFDKLTMAEEQKVSGACSGSFSSAAKQLHEVRQDGEVSEETSALKFTPSPFVTGRTRSRLSRCSMRTSRTPESLSMASLFEDTLPMPVRTIRQTPRSHGSGRCFNSPYTPGYATESSERCAEGDSLPEESRDTQSGTLSGPSASNSQADTLILHKSLSDSAEGSQSLDDTVVLEKNQDNSIDAYVRNLAEIIRAVRGQNRDLSEDGEMTDDLASSTEAKAEDPTAEDQVEGFHNDDVWVTEDSSSRSDSASSSSTSACLSPRRSTEDSDPPCTPGTGCTPRYSMSRLSSCHRPQRLANLSFTPGGRPVIQDLDEPTEFLYTDTEQGHKFIETHVPPTSDTSLSSGPSTSVCDETVLYDWRSLQTAMKSNKGKENQQPEEAAAQEEAPDKAAGKLLTDTRGMTDRELRLRLVELGESPGPISSRTRPTYLRRLCSLMQEENCRTLHPRKQSDHSQKDLGYSPELCRVLQMFQLPSSHDDEQTLCQQFDQPDQNRKWREGIIKSSFNYLLLDPRVTKNLPFRSHTITPQECFQTFIRAIFYVGKGKRSRPYSHLYEALEYYRGEKTAKKLCAKVQHILQVWAAEQGVISLHCFQNVIPVEAYTREACMVEAIGLKMLTNQKRGDFYGVVSTWELKRKRELGINLLYRAMQIFLAEGERQLRPADIRQ